MLRFFHRFQPLDRGDLRRIEQQLIGDDRTAKFAGDATAIVNGPAATGAHKAHKRIPRGREIRVAETACRLEIEAYLSPPTRYLADVDAEEARRGCDRGRAIHKLPVYPSFLAFHSFDRVNPGF